MFFSVPDFVLCVCWCVFVCITLPLFIFTRRASCFDMHVCVCFLFVIWFVMFFSSFVSGCILLFRELGGREGEGVANAKTLALSVLQFGAPVGGVTRFPVLVLPSCVIA